MVSSGGDSSMVFNLADFCILAGIVLMEAFVLRLIMEKGLRCNPFKAAVARMMRGTGGKNSR